MIGFSEVVGRGGGWLISELSERFIFKKPERNPTLTTIYGGMPRTWIQVSDNDNDTMTIIV